MPLILGGIALVAGGASAYMGSAAKKKAASKAAGEAQRMRQWYEARARDTKQTLGREIETMRSIRDLDLPGWKQAAQVAQLQQRKGYEAVARQRLRGKLPGEVREAIFGGQADAYFAREEQRISRYMDMTKNIFGAANTMQSQVNDLLKAGGAQYGGMMKTAQMMDYEAGSPMGQVLGAAAQGFSLAAQGRQGQQNLAATRKSNFMDKAMFGKQTPEELMGRQGEWGKISKMYDEMLKGQQ